MTISGTGDRRGFTLIEILLALALVALLAGIFIGGSSALLDEKAVPPDTVFWKACAQARKLALETHASAILAFDAKEHAFTVTGFGRSTQLPVKGADDLEIDFHPPPSDSSSSILVGGSLVETQPLARVEFYSDGTCTPFRAQVRMKGGAHLIAVDPWTCAPMLAKTDATP